MGKQCSPLKVSDVSAEQTASEKSVDFTQVYISVVSSELDCEISACIAFARSEAGWRSGTAAVLTELFLGFLQSLRAKYGLVCRLCRGYITGPD
jgi:hypothetical protein